ncbi:MAG: hypothetical protein WBP82_06920 [Leuconostoc mesenteroides]
MTNNNTKFNKINGDFRTRGDNGVGVLYTLTEFAQEHAIMDIITVGYTSNGDTTVSVVAYQDDDIIRTQMVTRGRYDLMDFGTERELKAFKNLSNAVVHEIGAYSNEYNVGVGRG